MKKILTMGIVALVLITMSSCQFNLFAAFDKIEIPSVAELESEASNNPAGFVSDVEDYIENNFLESEDVTDAQEQAIIDGLTNIYGGGTSASPAVKQQAAILVGELEITRDPATSAVVNGVIGAVSDALGASGTIDPEGLVGDIFPTNLDLAGLQNILNDLDNAAAAYSDLAPTLAGNDPGMTSGEVGDMTQLAIVALVIADIRSQVSDDTDLLDFITSGGSNTLAVTLTNPFDTTDGGPSLFESDLQDILTFAGLDLGI